MVALHERTLRITSRDGWGRNVPSEVLSEWLGRFPKIAAYATRLRCEGSSILPGKRPAWLDCMADTRCAGHEADGDATLLHFRSPTLGDAAPELFRQQRLFDLYPEPDHTAFDIVAEAFADIERANENSDRLDKALLVRIEHMRGSFASGVETVQFTDSIAKDQVRRIDASVIETASRWTTTPPKEQEARLVGTLDTVVWSSRGFVLVTQAGERVRGVLMDADPSLLKEWLGKQVLVHGRAVFRPSGALLRIEARHFENGTDAPSVFSRLPRPAFALKPRLPSPITSAVREGREINAFGATFGILREALTPEERRTLLADLR